MSLGQILSSKQIKRSTGETRKEAKWHLEVRKPRQANVTSLECELFVGII